VQSLPHVIGRRLLLLIPTLFAVSLIAFGIMQLAPGDPVRIYLSDGMGNTASPEDIERMREKLGLNDPLPVQYVRWLGEAAQGNFGYSIVSHRPVSEVILEKLPASLSLMGISLFVSVCLGLTIGTIAAIKQYSIFDYLTTTFAFLGNALPSFWIGMILIWVFSVRLGWLPTGQMHSVSTSDPAWLDSLKHYILPVAVTSFVSIITWVRYQRTSMLEVLHQDYIRTARAKGLHERRVILLHAWRNSLIPIVTLVGMSVATLVGGSYVIETIFAWPGLGQYGFDAVLARDYPVIMGITMFSALFIIFGNLLADVAYILLDPRMGGGQGAAR
jgi:peptide/nickel transport system permease protein